MMIKFKNVLDAVHKQCRPLEYELIKNLQTDNSKGVLNELLKYQNDDGGFGHALEPDLRCQESSSLATEQAILILNDIQLEAHDLIINILDYLEKSYDHLEKKWHIIPKEADSHPRAIWWEYEKADDFGRFNPSATFVGFMFKYAKETNVNLQEHISEIIQYILTTPSEEVDEHELYCFYRFKSFLPKELQIRFETRLDEIAYDKIEKLEMNWDKYVLEPIKIISSPQSDLYKNNKPLVDANLNHLFSSQGEDYLWYVKHEWYRFEEIFNKFAKSEWHGITTYHALKTIKAFEPSKLV
jgi:hypothetical protein